MRSRLLETDWNEEWKALQAKRRGPDDPSFWDARARHFRPRETHPYAQAFLELTGIRAGETVLDMGCGAGSLAIPLAHAGHRVIAVDFSPRMLAVLDETARECGLFDRIDPVQLAWDDDWRLAGIEPKSVDVALASRSIATADLKAALGKLTAAARRRCAITLIAGASPRYDEHIMDAIGASVTRSGDYVYAFNILIGMGLTPEVRYIASPRRDTFDSLEDGVADFSRMLEDGNEDRIDELRAYIAQHMVENPHVGEPGSKGRPQGAYMLDHIRMVRWAHLSWDARSATPGHPSRR
ncbi:methyltransferase domain-containing protein [Collinsella tanakaei]|uniref:class I SAM-dependent methyltransferase n=1 Tax=Collinsella tanakaei TaxID=626935 RepID=UPI00195D0AD5|nr:class I SAM-dependent methyltransferase [Collinsella tanakaei]MBM6755647.1 methyltransferase domain-containing protein [Collinsella tanakaei]MBM6867392.1 methyltransferase domain-containing protein [Collinsella tanakaei]